MQCAASARATECTAYSCSSRSLPLPSKAEARPASAVASPWRRTVPASTRLVTRSPVRRTSNSGVAPTRPATLNVQQDGYFSARFSSRCRISSSPSTCATTSRAKTTLSSSPASIRTIASATAPCQSGAVREPSAHRTAVGFAGTDTGRMEFRKPVSARGSLSGSTTVTQAWPPRRPMMIFGTLIIEVPGFGSKANEANATGPVPGTSTVSSMTFSAHHLVHQRCARLKRSGPLTSSCAATPQPIKPSPPRTHATGFSIGNLAKSCSGSGMGRVRTTVRSAFGVVSRRDIDSLDIESF